MDFLLGLVTLVPTLVAARWVWMYSRRYGHSGGNSFAKALGAGLLVLPLSIGIVSAMSGKKAPAQPTQIASSAPVAMPALPPRAPDPVKPGRLPDPKYNKMLSAAMPPEEAKLRGEWYAWNQFECSDSTAKKDKADLKAEQAAKLSSLKATYRSIFSGNNDMEIALKAKRYTDTRLDMSEEQRAKKLQKLQARPSPCLLKRATVDAKALDLSVVQNLINLSAKSFIKVYETGGKDLHELQQVQDYSANYRLRVQMAEGAIEAL